MSYTLPSIVVAMGALVLDCLHALSLLNWPIQPTSSESIVPFVSWAPGHCRQRICNHTRAWGRHACTHVKQQCGGYVQYPPTLVNPPESLLRPCPLLRPSTELSRAVLHTCPPSACCRVKCTSQLSSAGNHSCCCGLKSSGRGHGGRRGGARGGGGCGGGVEGGAATHTGHVGVQDGRQRHRAACGAGGRLGRERGLAVHRLRVGLLRRAARGRARACRKRHAHGHQQGRRT